MTIFKILNQNLIDLLFIKTFLKCIHNFSFKHAKLLFTLILISKHGTTIIHIINSFLKKVLI